MRAGTPSLVSGLCSVPYYEVVSIIQPGFQTQSVATTVLDSGCLHAFFNTNDEVCIKTTRDDIIHILLYNRYKYNRQLAKEKQAGHQFISLWDF